MILEPEQHGDVVFLHWLDGENRFRRESLDAWHAALDDLDARTGAVALVVVGDGKFFSNGLDLDWMSANPDLTGSMIDDVHRLFGRLLLQGCYTVAAINGHAFAAGAMLTCGFDHRVMRADRGYWCVPEVDLGLPFTSAMHAIVAARLPRTTTHEAMMTGRRYGADDALERRIVDEVAAEADVLPTAIAAATAMAGKDRAVIATHKRLLYADAAAVCGWTG
jgi:enoyl-CoA hydratase/carnithine racemase